MDRFWSKINKTADGCWEWTAFKTKDGYGRFRLDGEKLLSHRVAWSLVNGPLPDGVCICHSCDNPKCVNPDHLFVGTQQTNMADMINKGRRHDTAGAGNGNSKLTGLDVIEIRQKAADGQSSQRQLAREYGVSPRSIAFVVNRTTWKHI